MDYKRHDAHIKALKRIQLAQKNDASELSLAGLALERLPEELGELEALTTLRVNGCYELTDISSLQHCHSLTELELINCPKVADLSPLRGMLTLRSLHLGVPYPGVVYISVQGREQWSALTDIEALSDLTGLVYLTLSNCDKVSNLQTLAVLSELQYLDLRGCNLLQDLQPLADLKVLEKLYLSGCTQLQDLQALIKLKKLQYLDLENCPLIQNLEPLARTAALQHLNMSFCRLIQDLQPLAELTMLRHLDLGHCPLIQDLKPLAKLTALRHLDLRYCRQIQDLKPLATLTRLKDANLFSTSELDCSPNSQPFACWNELERLNANSLMGAPPELGSTQPESENVLPRLREWQRDLAAGEAPNSTVKLFVLGNGGVGKTQICRRLCGDGFDPSIPSTHGISLGQLPVAEANGELPAVDAHFWDFGGQDVFLGTHALFLDERAIYVIAWTPQHENSKESEQDEVLMRNRPLAYWLDYVRSLAGPQVPVIVVQSQCDRELDVRPVPVPPEHGFERLRFSSSSAKQDDGIERLQLELKSAARFQLERYGKVRLPASWVALGEVLRARIGEKTLPRVEFDKLCRAEHSTAVPDVVLEYLHRSGQVFWREGVFGNQVVLDLAWALDGVYAVLERKIALPEIRRQAGRFSPQLLGVLVWKDYTEAERELFLTLMQQCEICFNVAKDVFIAPARLPEQAAMKNDIQQVWREAAPNAVARLDYVFLHEGVLRAMLCGIGRQAGVHAVYWAYGVCFYDTEHKSTVRIESDLPNVAGGAMGGRITVEAAGPGAAPLAAHLVASIQRLNIGQPPQVTWELGHASHDVHAALETTSANEPAFASVHPAQPPRLADEAQPVYVSYAWGGESDALVDAFERRLPGNFQLVRDKREMRPGDWISRFMAEIGRADLVLVVLSEKYLRSVYCMRELLYLFNTSLGEREAFMRKVVPLRVGDVPISRALDRTAHIKHWKQEHEKLDAALADLDHASVGEADRAELLAMNDFQYRVSDMLAWMADTLMPQGTELQTKCIEAAINLLQQRALTLGRSG